MGTIVELPRILVIKLLFLLYGNGIAVYAEVLDDNLRIVVEMEEVHRRRRVVLGLNYLMVLPLTPR